jgi:hypothetical protein
MLHCIDAVQPGNHVLRSWRLGHVYVEQIREKMDRISEAFRIFTVIQPAQSPRFRRNRPKELNYCLIGGLKDHLLGDEAELTRGHP